MHCVKHEVLHVMRTSQRDAQRVRTCSPRVSHQRLQKPLIFSSRFDCSFPALVTGTTQPCQLEATRPTVECSTNTTVFRQIFTIYVLYVFGKFSLQYMTLNMSNHCSIQQPLRLCFLLQYILDILKSYIARNSVHFISQHNKSGPPP